MGSVHDDKQSTVGVQRHNNQQFSRFIIEIQKPIHVDQLTINIPWAKKKVLRIKNSTVEIDVVTDSISKVLGYISSLFLIVDIRRVKESTPNSSPSNLDILQHMLECEILSLSERFWECHTSLESVWMHSGPDTKIFLQSIILFSSSQAKYQMSNSDAAEKMYLRAYSMLSRSGKSNMVLTDMKHDFYYPIHWRFNISDEIRTEFYTNYFNLG